MVAVWTGRDDLNLELETNFSGCTVCCLKDKDGGYKAAPLSQFTGGIPRKTSADGLVSILLF